MLVYQRVNLNKTSTGTIFDQSICGNHPSNHLQYPHRAFINNAIITIRIIAICNLSYLVGGFNPSEKYESQLG